MFRKKLSSQGGILPVSIITLLFYSVAQALTILFPVYMSRLGFSPSLIGLIMGLSGLVMVVARPVAGRVVDRFGSIKIIIPILVLYPLLICGLFTPSIFLLSLTRALMGLFVSFFAASIMRIFIDLYPHEKRGAGLSVFSALTIFPTIYAAFLSLLLLNTFGLHYVLIGLLLVAIINAVIIVICNRHNNDLAVCEVVQRQGGYKINKFLFFSSSIMIFFVSIVNGAIYTFLPVYLLANGLKASGIYLLIQATVLFCCRLFFKNSTISLKIKTANYILLFSIFSSIATLIIATKPTLLCLLFSAILNGVAFAFFYPTLATLMLYYSPKESISYYLGLFTSYADFGLACGAIFMGVIAEAYSYEAMYFVCSIICVLSGVLFFLAFLINKLSVKEEFTGCESVSH